MKAILLLNSAFWKDIFRRLGSVDSAYDDMVQKLSWEDGNCVHLMDMWWDTDCPLIAATTYQKTILTLSGQGPEHTLRVDPLLGAPTNDVTILCHVNGNHYVTLDRPDNTFLERLLEQYPLTRSYSILVARGQRYQERRRVS
jgi:hypothetical protein